MEHTTNQTGQTTSQRVAAVVADEMTRLDMSLRTLSATASIPLATLHRSINGPRPLRLDELDRIALALGTTAESLAAKAA